MKNEGSRGPAASAALVSAKSSVIPFAQQSFPGIQQGP
jgi:hypothetical protein